VLIGIGYLVPPANLQTQPEQTLSHLLLLLLLMMMMMLMLMLMKTPND
jgi:hypothetical protein